jgi:hypothetical protein
MKSYIRCVIVIGIIFLISSCEADDVNPFGGDDRDKFIGTWTCSETSETGNQISYTIKIGKSQNSAEVWIEGYAAIGFGDTASGIVAGEKISIPSQSPCQGWVVEGRIEYKDTDLLNGDHDVIAGGDKIAYTAEYTR